MSTTPLDDAWLAHLRHELRTPLNHIVGYTEMLVEDVADAGVGFDELAAGLGRVHANARIVQARISSHLGTAWDHAEPPDLGVLARELGDPVDRISDDVALLGGLTPPASLPQLPADLARIAAAAAALRRLIAGGLAPPAAAAPASPIGVAHGVAPAPSGAGLILVVDDDADNRTILGRWLLRDGHRVVTAASGAEALAKLDEQAFDLMLLDMVMPDMSGLDVLAALRDRAAAGAAVPPVLMISAYDESHSMAQCIGAGAEDYLPKPFDPVLMRARVGASLERKRLRDRETQHVRELARWNHELEDRVAEQVAALERLGRLKRFFSPQLAEAIVSGGADDPMRTHRRDVTVCFIDLRGFTAFAEAVEPEEVMAVLREYHAEMGRIIMAHEGTLERFTGDGLMVFFNDPVPVPNPGERALRMAVEMRERINVLIERWHRLGYELDLGIGIAQGFATIGAIGFEGRWDYGAIGSVTNLAARLCSEARPGQTLLSRRVLLAAEHLVQAEPVGELALKGFARPVAVHQLIGLRG